MRRKDRRRIFYAGYRPGSGGSERPRRILMVISAVVFVVSAALLIRYGIDALNSRQASDELRNVYYADTTGMPEVTDVPERATAEITDVPEKTAAVDAYDNVQAASTAQVTALPAAQPTAAAPLGIGYPDNPYLMISDRFAKLKKKNTDIIGWITVPGQMDEPVVQRDDEYYMKHDYKNLHNANGAIFLTQECSLNRRPGGLVLFGHNMKSGMMFGWLHKYAAPDFYHNNAYITFDTQYEDGKYVIFAVSTIHISAGSYGYVSPYALIDPKVPERGKTIDQLIRLSEYTCEIPVSPEDQFLLLVTCTGDDTERLVVAARRIREGEKESELNMKVLMAGKK